MGFHHVGQAGLELLASSDPSTSASQINSQLEKMSLCRSQRTELDLEDLLLQSPLVLQSF
ncbi:hypothetical protein H8958_022396 [Nasalis larvatus]